MSSPSDELQLERLPTLEEVVAEEEDQPQRWPEFKILFNLAIPTIIQTTSQQAMAFTDTIFLGHLGTEELAAGALANTYAAFLTFFLLGTATALDTLGSAAYGARRRGIQAGPSLSTWTLTSFMVLNALCLIVTVGLCLAKPVARYVFGQGEDIANLMSSYCFGLIPGIWPMIWSVVMMKFLQVQNCMYSSGLATLTAFAINIGCNVAFIRLAGFQGAALATSFSRFVLFIFMLIIVYMHERKRRLQLVHTPSPSAFMADGHVHKEVAGSTAHPCHHLRPFAVRYSTGSRVLVVLEPIPEEADAAGLQQVMRGRSIGWAGGVWEQVREAAKPALLKQYLKLGLPGGVMMSCEQGSFDITTAMAGWYATRMDERTGAATISAHSAMLNIIQLTFVSCPFAVGIAGSIRVGNLLGAMKARTARTSGWMCVAIGMVFMGVCAVVIISARDVIGRIFTKDDLVVSTMATLVPMAALFQVSDGMMGTAQGVLRGCGRQRILMVYNIAGFWGCGVLLGYLLCFQAGLGIKGLWWGIATGDTITAIMNVVTLALVKWSKECSRAHKRLTMDKPVEVELSTPPPTSVSAAVNADDASASLDASQRDPTQPARDQLPAQALGTATQSA